MSHFAFLYCYDANGNRSNHTAGADNRLQSDGTYAYTHDREGNRTRRTHLASGEVTDYTWTTATASSASRPEPLPTAH